MIELYESFGGTYGLGRKNTDGKVGSPFLSFAVAINETLPKKYRWIGKGPEYARAIRRALEPQETGAAKERQGRRTDLVGNAHEVGGGKTRDKVAEFAGTSARTLNRATAVVEAAESHPEKSGHLILGYYGMP